MRSPLTVTNLHVLSFNCQCYLHTWYLSADFQMYVGSLPIIMILYKWPKFGCLVSLLGIVASVAGTFQYTYAGNRPPTVIFDSPVEIVAFKSAVEIYTITLPHIAPYSKWPFENFRIILSLKLGSSNQR